MLRFHLCPRRVRELESGVMVGEPDMLKAFLVEAKNKIKQCEPLLYIHKWIYLVLLNIKVR